MQNTQELCGQCIYFGGSSENDKTKETDRRTQNLGEKSPGKYSNAQL